MSFKYKWLRMSHISVIMICYSKYKSTVFSQRTKFVQWFPALSWCHKHFWKVVTEAASVRNVRIFPQVHVEHPDGCNGCLRWPLPAPESPHINEQTFMNKDEVVEGMSRVKDLSCFSECGSSPKTHPDATCCPLQENTVLAEVSGSVD